MVSLTVRMWQWMLAEKVAVDRFDLGSAMSLKAANCDNQTVQMII